MSLSFDSQAQGTVSASQSVTVTNTGTGQLTITAKDVTGDFAITDGIPTCSAGPVAPTARCVINVTFAPKATGTRNGTLTITDDDGGVTGSPQVVPLKGTGTTAPAAPTAPAASAKPGGIPCLNLKPDWVSIPKEATLTPIVISSCDTPALDLSKDKVTLESANPNPDPNLQVSLPPDTCKAVTTSELDCDLTVTPADGPKKYDVKYYVAVLNKTERVGRPIELHIGDRNLYWMILAGIDLTSTTSGPNQQWFARASLMEKLLSYPGASKQHGVWGWLDAKIGSMPTQKTSALSSLSSVSSAVSSSGIQSVGDIAQTLEFRTGLSFYLSRRIGFISGFGGSSPINPVSGAQEYSLSGNLYKQFANQSPASQSLQQTYPQLWNALQTNQPIQGCYTTTPAPSGCTTTVAFVLPNRSRFYRSYFGGLRLWTKEGDQSIFPGLLDLTVGQNETVTGGVLRGVVLTLTGDYPLAGGTFRLFGSAFMRISSNTNGVTMDMSPVTSAVSPTSSSVVIQSTVPLDQDYFRVGVAVDIVKVLATLTKPKTQ
jgi:hypothetical protein